MRKILFLDVDGVLNSLTSGGRYALKRPCLKRLENIVKETGCEIVLSSTWRKDQYALKRLKRVLAYRGLEISSITPDFADVNHLVRGDEILEWMVLNLTIDEWRSVKYAIVDDDSDMLERQLPHFFQTDPQYGMTDIIAYRIAYHLNETDDGDG